MTLTMPEIRRRFPHPSPFCRRDYDKPDDAHYCVGGAFCLATHPAGIDERDLIAMAQADDDGEDVDDYDLLYDETRFPTEIPLTRGNDQLVGKWSPLIAIWGATDMLAEFATTYETAIRGANDSAQWGDTQLALAWQLLDDALTYTPETFDRIRQGRLLAGMVMYGLSDSPPGDADRVAHWQQAWTETAALLMEYEPEVAAWAMDKGLNWHPLVFVPSEDEGPAS